MILLMLILCLTIDADAQLINGELTSQETTMLAYETLGTTCLFFRIDDGIIYLACVTNYLGVYCKKENRG